LYTFSVLVTFCYQEFQRLIPLFFAFLQLTACSVAVLKAMVFVLRALETEFPWSRFESSISDVFFSTNRLFGRLFVY